MIRGTRSSAFAVALCAVTMLGACKKGESNATDTTTMASADTSMKAGTGSSTSMNAAASAPAAMTDAQVFAMLAAANQGEIAAGKMAETKATSASVKAFARDMVTAHTGLLNSGNALARKLNITPDTAAADSINAMNQSTASTLSSTPKGAAFDSAYVNAQAAGHQYVLDLVKRAEGQAQNAQLKAALPGIEAKVQQHLDRIQGIRSKMK
ncbi:MAG: DUF4142 domain-containing protein [Gemmatimonadaceae bacterium]